AETYETEGTRYAAREPIRANEPTAPVRYETAPRSRIGWWWALPALLLALLLGNMLTHRRQPSEVAVIQTVPAPRVVVPPAPAAPTIPATRMVVTSGKEPSTVPAMGSYRLEFRTGSDRLTPRSAAELRKVVIFLKAHPGAHADISGYTDNVGNDAANMKLSEARATTIMRDLERRGVDNSRLTAKGYGEESPTADNNTAGGPQKNRPVEIELTEK